MKFRRRRRRKRRERERARSLEGDGWILRNQNNPPSLSLSPLQRRSIFFFGMSPKEEVLFFLGWLYFFFLFRFFFLIRGKLGIPYIPWFLQFLFFLCDLCRTCTNNLDSKRNHIFRTILTMTVWFGLAVLQFYLLFFLKKNSSCLLHET